MDYALVNLETTLALRVEENIKVPMCNRFVVAHLMTSLKKTSIQSVLRRQMKRIHINNSLITYSRGRSQVIHSIR